MFDQKENTFLPAQESEVEMPTSNPAPSLAEGAPTPPADGPDGQGMLKAQPRPKKKFFIIGIIIGVIILITGGVGVYAYIYLQQKLNDPKKIWDEAIANSENAKTVSTDVKVSVDIVPDKDYKPKTFMQSSVINKPISFAVQLNADSVNNKEKPQASGSFSFTIPTGADIPFLGGVNITPKFSFISSLDIAYFRIDSIPPIPFFDMSKYQNKWIKIDLKEIEKQWGVQFQQVDPRVIQEQQKKIYALYDQNEFLIHKKVGEEMKNDIKMYHYALSLDKERFGRFFKAIMDYVFEKYPEYQLEMAKGAEFNKNWEAIMKLVNISGNAWIGKDDHYFKEITFVFEMDLPESGFIYSGNTDLSAAPKVGKLKINADIAYSNYNKPMNIVEPSEYMTYIDFTKAIQEDFTKSMGQTGLAPGSGSEPVDLEKDSDNDGLPDYSEEFYGTSANNPDSDGDGYLDGDEVKNGYNPLGSGKLQTVK